MPADRTGSVRVEQIKLVAPHMTSFVDAMRAALHSRLWERSQPAESSGQPHPSSPPAAVAPDSVTTDEALVDSHIVDMLVAMGFPKHRAAKAALETGNTGGSLQLQWLWDTQCCLLDKLYRDNTPHPTCILRQWSSHMQASLPTCFALSIWGLATAAL